MPFTRLYTGSDGKSYIEEMDPETHPTLQELLAATGISFSIAQPGHFSDWHTAPRRQFVITLSGEGEIGSSRRLTAQVRAGPRQPGRRCYRGGPYNPGVQRCSPDYRHGKAGRLEFLVRVET